MVVKRGSSGPEVYSASVLITSPLPPPGYYVRRGKCGPLWSMERVADGARCLPVEGFSNRQTELLQ